jgi:dihydropteroate synthase-like protein
MRSDHFFFSRIIRVFMRVLLPTGAVTAPLVRDAARGLDAVVVVTGEIASFLTPKQVRDLVMADSYDIVIVSGMCTASFAEVEEETGVPIYRGPRHAADLTLVLPMLDQIALSRTVPADEFLAVKKQEEAGRELERREAAAEAEFLIRGVKIGGTARMKVLAEIMDAHRREDLPSEVKRYFDQGADIVDLGFGFDATPQDVLRCFSSLEGEEGPLAIDTQDPQLIEAALFRADLVLSIHEGNMPLIGEQIALSGTAAVVIPHELPLERNLESAEEYGIECIIADPVLMPAGSGLVSSLASSASISRPLFFGAGNVVELMDADSPGINALLAGMAHELGASIIFTSEHSDKTKGSITEMRRATEMMALLEGRPYPKDLGIDLLLIKEKRRRREPPLSYHTSDWAEQISDEIVYDPCGNFRIGIEGDCIVAVIDGRAIRGRSWADVFSTIMRNGDVSLLDHAAYLGKELYKAELAIQFGRSFEQDGPF